jgi:ABC-type glutathione transport system ATPase component
MDEAAKADRVIVLDRGKVEMDASPKEVFCQEEKLIEMGLSVPDSTALFHSLQKLGADLKGEALEPTECAKEILRLLKGKTL